MRTVTDREVDFILGDLQENGVIIEDLQENLLDHICCIIENEMDESDDFYLFYEKILPQFFKKELKEIQEETENLLTFKNYYAMKNTLKIAGLSSAILTIIGTSLKVLHLPGAGISIVLGGMLFCLIFLPLMIVLKFKDEEKQIDKIVLSFGFLIAIVGFMGMIFKLMHWPWANIMTLTGITSFVFIYVPVYYLTRVRNAEMKFNTTVNSVLMMASGGLFFALFNLGYSKETRVHQNAFSQVVNSNNELLEKISNYQNLDSTNTANYQSIKNELSEMKKNLEILDKP